MPKGKAERVVVVGYYGHGNIGDESILRSLLTEAHRLRPQLAFYVLCGGRVDGVAEPSASESSAAESVAAESGAAAPSGPPLDLTYVPRLAPAQLLRAMRNSRMLVMGGGSLIQDVTSLRSLLYYLGLIWTAKRLGLPVAICGGGIGPVNSAGGRWLARRVLPQVDLLALRDRRSVEAAASLGVPAARLLLTADPAFSLGAGPGDSNEIDSAADATALPLDPAVSAALARSGVPADRVDRLLGVALRPPMQREDESAVAAALRQAAAEHGLFPLLIPFHPEQDTVLLERIASTPGLPAAVLKGVRDPDTLFGVTRRLRAMVSMRLHGLIFAVAAGVPCVALPYDPKVDALALDVPQIRYVRYPRIDPADLAAALREAWFAPDELRQGLLDAARTLRSRAQANARRMVEMLDRAQR